MINIVIGAAIMSGILLAGSEGPWFPWVNIFGVVVFALCSVRR